jgi:hypothetical protein
MHSSLFRSGGIVIALAATLAAAACTAQDSDQVGTVGVALTATDASGASYRLTPGARLRMISGTYWDELALDGDSAFVRLDVPAGDYSAELVHDTINGVRWPLERTDLDGTVETVVATLTTPMPAALTVPADGQTNLVLRFEVPGFGPITFTHGSVDVSIDVVESSAGGVEIGVEGPVTVNTVIVGATAPPQLADRMPATGATPYVGITVRVTGEWEQSWSTGVCAPATVTIYGGGHQGLHDLMIEALEGAVTVCVDGGSSIVQVYSFSSGAGFTPTFGDLGALTMSFLTVVNADLPAPVFDGQTLDLDPAVGVTTVPATWLFRVNGRMPTDAAMSTWYRASLAGDVTLSLILTP